MPRSTDVAPGKEVELYNWSFDLQPKGGINKESFTIHGTGKFSLQCQRVVGPTSGNPNHPNPTLNKLATGKLELEIQSEPPAPTEKKTKPADKQAEQPKEGLLPRGPYTTGPIGPDIVPQTEAFTAWGKEIGGLQAGLGFRPSEHQAYHHGESVKLVVRVRNVGKEAVKFQYLRQFFIENPPTVKDSEGKPVPLATVTAFGFHVPVEVTLAPEKDIELYELKLELKPGIESGGDKLTDLVSRFSTLYGTGKFQIQYERVFGNSSSGSFKPDPALSKLATGKLELEIKSVPPAASEKK